MAPPPIVLEFGTPSAIVSPSLAPANAKSALLQTPGFNAGKVGLKVNGRCSRIGVPPLPMAIVPVVARFPEKKVGPLGFEPRTKGL